MKKLFQSMGQLLNQGESFVLATILTQSGSSPRTAGAKMVIRADKSILGTIGGGLVEGQVQQMAQDIFETKQSATREFDLTGSQAGQMDMICGGRLEVLVEYVDALDTTVAAVYQEVINTLEKRKKVALVTPICTGESQGKNVPCLVTEDGKVIGNFNGPSRWLEALIGQAKGSYPQVINIEENRFLVEPIHSQGTVYIFGAGHVSQKLALLTTMVDFRTVVLDDRVEFANRERFNTADQVILRESFEQAFKDLEVDQESYLVIVTRGHAHDKTVLGQALRTGAGYIGMIGSKRKRDAIYRALLEEGFTEKDLKRVYSPIGIEIEAETPEEIAVSIVAELIKVRAEQGK